MEIQLLPAVSLLPETLSVLIAPQEMLARALNGNPHLQHFGILFITGIRSGILTRLNRSSIDLIVRRAFTSLQLRAILEENRHSILILEHNPLLYERARNMAERVAQAIKQAARETTTFLCSSTGPASGSNGRVCRMGILLLSKKIVGHRMP